MELLESMKNYQEYIVSPSGKKYTNEKNIPLLTARMYILAYENGYKGTGSIMVDGKPKISVTTLIGVPKQYLYSIMYPDLDVIKDVSDITSSAKGTIFHNELEKSIKEWGDTSIEAETRKQKEFNGWIIDGEWDICQDNMIKDLKTTSNWKIGQFLKEKKEITDTGLLNTDYSIKEAKEKYPTYFNYVLQLSIYKWLKGNVKDEGSIIYILTNGGGYSNLNIEGEIYVPLIPNGKLEEWMKERLDMLQSHLDNKTLPDCTDTERGFKKGTWKLTRYSQKTGKYRTVSGTTSDTEAGFNSLIAGKTKAGDIIVETEPEYLACSWCKYSTICEQYNKG